MSSFDVVRNLRVHGGGGGGFIHREFGVKVSVIITARETLNWKYCNLSEGGGRAGRRYGNIKAK